MAVIATSGMRLHASYWKRAKYPAPIPAPLSRLISLLQAELHSPSGSAEDAQRSAAQNRRFCSSEVSSVEDFTDLGASVLGQVRTDHQAIGRYAGEHFVHLVRHQAGQFEHDIGAENRGQDSLM